MASSRKPSISPLDLTGIGSTFDSIPFRSKHHVYRMPKELALPISPLVLVTITAVKASTKSPVLPTLSENIPLKNCKQNQEKLTGHEDALLDDKVSVFGVDLDGYTEVQRGGSVYERFMREEGVNERLWYFGQQESRRECIVEGLWGKDTWEVKEKEIGL
ncbi:hypothetical protein DL98DRAFT_540929 [Cadophora sp. DSE1049]|nr:hypothetical protein DL98DRAFT_540929 [Cadophora sp. DSE1049]